jgi:hypothetical protein
LLTRNDYQRAYGWQSKTINESEMALCMSARRSVL